VIRYQGRQYRLAGQLQQIPTWEEMWENVQDDKDLEEEALLIADGNDDPDVLESAALEVESEYRDIYDNTIAQMQAHDGADIFRAVVLPKTIDPTTLDNLGTYWADNEMAAHAHWGGEYEKYWKGRGEGHEVVYRARCDAADINLYSSIAARMVFTGAEEDEVNIFHDSRIFVYDATLPDGSVLPINDWRNTGSFDEGKPR